MPHSEFAQLDYRIFNERTKNTHKTLYTTVLLSYSIENRAQCNHISDFRNGINPPPSNVWPILPQQIIKQNHRADTASDNNYDCIVCK